MSGPAAGGRSTLHRPDARLAHTLHQRLGVCRLLLAGFKRHSPRSQAADLRDRIRRILSPEVRQLKQLQLLFEEHTPQHQLFVPLDVLDDPPAKVSLTGWLVQRGVTARRVNRQLSDRCRMDYRAGDRRGLLAMVAMGHFHEPWVQDELLALRVQELDGDPPSQAEAGALLDAVVSAMRRKGKGRMKLTAQRKRQSLYNPATQKRHRTKKGAYARVQKKIQRGVTEEDAIAWVMSDLTEKHVRVRRGIPRSGRIWRALSDQELAALERELRRDSSREKPR